MNSYLNSIQFMLRLFFVNPFRCNAISRVELKLNGKIHTEQIVNNNDSKCYLYSSFNLDENSELGLTLFIQYSYSLQKRLFTVSVHFLICLKIIHFFSSGKTNRICFAEMYYIWKRSRLRIYFSVGQQCCRSTNRQFFPSKYTSANILIHAYMCARSVLDNCQSLF